MDLTQELERSIPMGPPLPPPAERLVAGRRALRRRRAAAAVGAAAVIVALAVPVAVLGGHTADRGVDVPPVAPAPSAPDRSDGDAPTGEPTRSSDWPGGENLAWVVWNTGKLRIHPDAVVHERRDDLFPGTDIESVALDLSVGDQRQWVFLEWDELGGAAAYGEPRSGAHENFDDFVATQVRTGPVQHGPPVGGDPPGGGL